MARRIAFPALILLLLSLPASLALQAQQNVRQLLTNGDSKSWYSNQIEREGLPVEGSFSITYFNNGTFTEFDLDSMSTGRWELAPDGRTILAFERVGGGAWDDTVRTTIEKIDRTTLVASRSDGDELLRIYYIDHADTAFPDTSLMVSDHGWPTFLATFRDAVKKHDRAKVASMTSFPFHSYDLAGYIRKPDHGPEYTREEFLKYYDRLFTGHAKQLIAVSTPTPLTDDDGQINRYAIGIGGGKTYTVWIEFWLDESGHWWLARTDNVSYGDDDE